MELAYIFEKCLKLLPWLQDLHSSLGGWGRQGVVKEKVDNPPVAVCSFLFISYCLDCERLFAFSQIKKSRA